MPSVCAGLANRDKAPYAPQDSQEVGQVLKDMNGHAQKGKAKGKGGFFVKKKTFTVDSSGRTVDSWMLQDWDYKKANLPTYARGLFTHSNNGKPEIAVRGYDKFFNVNETNKTQWCNIENNTRGPYELSVKENGCIIFIASLDGKDVLITSKHSTGPRQDASANHAAAGEKWLESQLARVGKTRNEFAQKLSSMNATAVAELCDDEFEEHVLQYTPDQAGLYLHGINLNLPEFATFSGTLVAKFAEEWGFKQTMYVLHDDIQSVKAFLESVGETGNYAGRDTEGFVIRCQARESPEAPWHDWFFKYKFEEPYLMYRQWREVTKSVISGKPPRYNKHKKITEEYLGYARRQLAKDPSIGKAFNQNHGIIAMREGFLQEKGLRGSDIIRDEAFDGSGAVIRNVVLCPVATIGCGKTTIAIALVKLFGWGHVQNDNIVGKGNKSQRFAQACLNALANHPAMIADRNNHQKREREQIIKDLRRSNPEVTIVALHYVHDTENYDDIRTSTRARVLSRGDNHQTIQAKSKELEIMGVMEGFLNRFQPVDPQKSPDDGFDLIIDLDVEAESKDNLHTILNQLHDHYPHLFQVPSDDAINDAINHALNEYAPDIKHDLSGGGSKKKEHKRDKTPQEQTKDKRSNLSTKPPAIEFFAISLPTERFRAILDAIFSSEKAAVAKFYHQLHGTRRLQQAFHVTLIHRATISQNHEYWQELDGSWHNIWDAKPDSDRHRHNIGGTDGGVVLGEAKVLLDHVVWDDRVMAILVSLQSAGNGPEFRTVNQYAHVTVGTASDQIKPKESNDMLAKWMGAGDYMTIKSLKVKGNIVLDGVVRGVLRR